MHDAYPLPYDPYQMWRDLPQNVRDYYQSANQEAYWMVGAYLRWRFQGIGSRQSAFHNFRWNLETQWLFNETYDPTFIYRTDHDSVLITTLTPYWYNYRYQTRVSIAELLWESGEPYIAPAHKIRRTYWTGVPRPRRNLPIVPDT